MLRPPAMGNPWSGIVEVFKKIEGDTFIGHLPGLDLDVLVGGITPDFVTATVYFLEVVDLELLTMRATTTTKVIPHVAPTSASWTRVKELCAGLGGIGKGCQQLGAVVCASVDRNAAASTQLHSSLHGTVISGDITCDRTIYALHMAGGTTPATTTSGFPCQPFSAQGDQKTFHDERIGGFWATLRTAWMTRAACLLLECVPQAGQHPRLQQALVEFAELMQWRIQPVVLPLHLQWPARRTRWWCLLSPTSLPHVPLACWPPSKETPTVGNYIKNWPYWNLQDERNLSLTEDELQMYTNPLYGDDQRVLDINKPCPVALHSYGSVTGPCPCKCRGPFNPARLRQGGVRGFYIRSQLTSQFRYLRPNELGFLLSFDPVMHLGVDLKTALCLLGQSAAPLQTLWIYAHLLRAVQLQDRSTSDISPLQAIEDYKHYLMQRQFHFWAKHHPAQICRAWVIDADDSYLDIKFTGNVTVEQILNAEQGSQPWGSQPQLLDGHQAVSHGAWMQTAGMFGPYRLIYALKKQRRLQPSGLVAITIRANDEEIVTYKDAGSFIFEVLREYHIDENAKIFTDHGLRVAQDLRVWNTASFHITTGGGAAANQGMTAQTLWPLALNLLNYYHHESASGPLLGCLIEPTATHPLMLHQHPAASNITGWQLWLVLHQGHWLLLELHAPPALAPVGVAKLYNAHMLHSTTQQLQHLLLDLEKSLHIKIILNNNKGGRDQAHPATCGTVLLGNLAHALQIHHLWPSNQDEELHAGILQAFPQIHQQHIGCGPAEESVVLRAIETILLQKGVPTTRVRERAHAALKKIGLQELQQVVQLKNPWPAMKSVASRPSINFMWVAHDELQAQIREKAEDKFKIQSSKRKTTRTSKDAPPPLLQVEPHLLQLAPNTFVHQNQPVTQIDLGALSTATNGIAFGSVADVLPYLKEGKPINNTAVGVLTTTPVPAERCGLLPVRHLRFPALYTPTGEPLLIAGSLILLGQGSIDRADHSGGPSFEIMATQTLRFSVYKDQWTGTWELFLQKPVRELIQKFPILRLCKEESCGDSCPFYHPPVDEAVDNVIMDLWSRTWLSAEGKFCKPENAAYWTVLARVPKFVQHSLQGLSATAGLYVEPRTSGGKEADPAYAMVWLGNISVGAAMHKCRTTPTAIAVGRLHQKYGVRVLDSDAEETFKKLRPEELFINTKATSIYRLFPLPFGMQRHSLQKAITKWGWQARVLQPIGGGVAGSTWEVAAAVPPPAELMQTAEGDVIVTLGRHLVKDPTPPPILATSSMRQQLHKAGQPATTSTSDDPWVLGPDPWSQRTSNSHITPQDKYQQMEVRLRDGVRSTLRKELEETSMQVDSASGIDHHFADSTVQRIQTLEQDMLELKAHNQNFQQWFKDSADANQKLQINIHELQTVVHTHSSELGNIRSDFAGHSNSVGDALRQVRADMQTEMGAGFSRLEALLEKRPRSS